MGVYVHGAAADRLALRRGDTGIFAREIAEEVGKVEKEQRRLADLYIGGSIPQDIFDIKSQKLSQDRLRLRAESRLLVDLQPSGINLDLLEKTLPDAAARIKEWVLQASDEDMELILRGLDLQIRASGEGVQIEGCVPAQVEEEDNLVTIAQTSASPRGCSRPSRWV